MYVQFCNEAKSCVYWLVNETLWYETETRPRHLIFSPRRDRDRDLPTFPRDRDETETFGNYVSIPRRRDRDYIPGQQVVLCKRGFKNTEQVSGTAAKYKYQLSLTSQRCIAADVLQTKVDAQCDKLVTELNRQRLRPSTFSEL